MVASYELILRSRQAASLHKPYAREIQQSKNTAQSKETLVTLTPCGDGRRGPYTKGHREPADALLTRGTDRERGRADVAQRLPNFLPCVGSRAEELGRSFRMVNACEGWRGCQHRTPYARLQLRRRAASPTLALRVGAGLAAECACTAQFSVVKNLPVNDWALAPMFVLPPAEAFLTTFFTTFFTGFLTTGFLTTFFTTFFTGFCEGDVQSSISLLQSASSLPAGRFEAVATRLHDLLHDLLGGLFRRRLLGATEHGGR